MVKAGTISRITQLEYSTAKGVSPVVVILGTVRDNLVGSLGSNMVQQSPEWWQNNATGAIQQNQNGSNMVQQGQFSRVTMA